MKEIDARQWDQDVKDTLADAAVSGGVVLKVNDNLEVLVLDKRLWDTIQHKLPSVSQIIRELKALQPKN